MALKILCSSNFTCFSNIFLLIVCFNLISCENKCTPGLKTPGYTIPQGDIVIEYGNPLDIICSLYDSAAMKEGESASSKLIYTRNNEIIPKEMIEIINSTSIRLHIENPPNVSSDSYTCILNDIKNTSVCMNLVSVGHKPLPITDFKCISMNYDNLTCTWTPPENYIKTDYNLTFSLKGRASRYVNNGCPYLKYPTESDPLMSCFWNISTTPQYRQAHNEIYFTLTAKNRFGVYQMNKTFLHFQHVLSGPPENLTALSKTSSSIYLYWMVPSSMQSFPRGLQHRVLYQCDGEKDWKLAAIIKNEKTVNEIRYNLTNLQYAYWFCDIRVSIRSNSALADDESMWSNNASLATRTKSRLPERPPPTNIGSFEVVGRNTAPLYEAYIYWQQIDKAEQNGPDFNYIIEVENNATLRPVEMTDVYARYQNLSASQDYTFNIWSNNTLGRSVNKSTIFIAKREYRMKELESFTKLEYGNGSYELTWEPSLETKGLNDYTIYWCSNERDRPYQCKGNLYWLDVLANQTAHNQTVSSNKVFQFAISANSKTNSSGMLWASCTVIHNRNIGKMKSVWINRVGSTFIEIGWKLDCADRIGRIEGFIIYYCPLKSLSQLDCDGPQQNVTIKGGDNKLSANVTNLKPYTVYMLSVAIINKHTTFSQQSDPLFNTTLEAAPSTPPLNINAYGITNSTITLSWEPPIITNGVLKYYSIQYNNYTKTIDPKTTFTLRNLQSYKSYLITIRACTIECSEESKVLNVTTKIGYPDQVSQPTVARQNGTTFVIVWDQLTNPSGRNDYYEVRMSQRKAFKLIDTVIDNVTSREYIIKNCGETGKYTTFFISVRAINIADDGNIYKGEWSNALESYCNTQNNYLLMVLIVIIMLCIILLVAYTAKLFYGRYKVMKNVTVKLPAGLMITQEITDVDWTIEKLPQDHDIQSQADEALLLNKINLDAQSTGNTSGCSSGHESVISVMDTNNHPSNASDSGTEQSPTCLEVNTIVVNNDDDDDDDMDDMDDSISVNTNDDNEIGNRNSLRCRVRRLANNNPIITSTNNNRGYVDMAENNIPLTIWPRVGVPYCVYGVDPTIPNVPKTSTVSSFVPITSTVSSYVPITSTVSSYAPITSTASSYVPITSTVSSYVPVTSTVSSYVPITSTVSSYVPIITTTAATPTSTTTNNKNINLNTTTTTTSLMSTPISTPIALPTPMGLPAPIPIPPLPLPQLLNQTRNSCMPVKKPARLTFDIDDDIKILKTGNSVYIPFNVKKPIDNTGYVVAGLKSESTPDLNTTSSSIDDDEFNTSNNNFKED